MARARRRLKPYKAQLETLEPRKLLSVRGETILPIAAAVSAARAARTQPPVLRPDLDAYAAQLVQHPGQAAHRGLGALAHLLREDGRMAAHDGWGTVLALALTEHPYYTATHHLAGLLTPPAPPVTTPSAPSAASLPLNG